MKVSTLVSKPIARIGGGGAFIIDRNTGVASHWFKNGASASKFWVKTFKRDPSRTIITKASTFNYLIEKGLLNADKYAIHQ